MTDGEHERYDHIFCCVLAFFCTSKQDFPFGMRNCRISLQSGSTVPWWNSTQYIQESSRSVLVLPPWIQRVKRRQHSRIAWALRERRQGGGQGLRKGSFRLKPLHFSAYLQCWPLWKSKLARAGNLRNLVCGSVVMAGIWGEDESQLVQGEGRDGWVCFFDLRLPNFFTRCSRCQEKIETVSQAGMKWRVN